MILTFHNPETEVAKTYALIVLLLCSPYRSPVSEYFVASKGELRMKGIIAVGMTMLMTAGLSLAQANPQRRNLGEQQQQQPHHHRTGRAMAPRPGRLPTLDRHRQPRCNDSGHDHAPRGQ